MRRPLLPALLLVGCRYTLIPEARICEDLAYAVSERTLVCTEDASLAVDHYDAFVEQTRCLLSDEVDDPYNPDGVLPASDNPEETARLEGLYDCVRAVREADCAQVEASGDDPAFWLDLHASCPDIASVGGRP